MSDTIKGSIIGAIITSIGAILIFFLGNFSTQATLEKSTVKTLSEYFTAVDKDMTYKDALQTVYEENQNLKNDVKELNSQLEEQNAVDEVNQTIKNATEYWNNSDYNQALSALNNFKNKSPEINSLIEEYTKEYEQYISGQADTLKNENIDEANKIVKDALNVLPESKVLKDKLTEIENSYPHNMVDVVPAYQSGGNEYKEYTSSHNGTSEFFMMGGIKYRNGMTFNADINAFNDVSWAVYNLDKRYNNLEFMLGHVDASDLGSETFLEIYYDGELKEEISVTPDMLPKQVSIDISGVSQLKMQVHSSGSDSPLYGLGNPMIK